jgi:autotransporter-associated beta strand protein
VTFNGAGLIQVSNAVRNPINFAGGVPIIKDGSGTALLTQSNTLRGGAVWVRGSTLSLAHNFALGGAGTTTVSNGATLALAGNLRLDSGPITLAGILRSGLGANVVSDTITLSGSNAVFAVPNSLTVSGVVAGAAGFTKLGAGGLNLLANNTYSGPTLLNEGSLTVNGLQPNSPILLNGGRLSGRGTVGVVSSLAGGGVIELDSLETQSCAGLMLNAATTARFSLAGSSSGPRFGQLVVNGPVSLGASVLDLEFGSTQNWPVPGDVITILRNDESDPIVGTFANLPEGRVRNLGYAGAPLFCRVSYAGGDGNDVTLTVMPIRGGGEKRGLAPLLPCPLLEAGGRARRQEDATPGTS